MTRGFFITLEGGEGAGKSTQAARLAARIAATGREVVCTREPGGSVGAEAIRALLVAGEVGRWSATTETLLMYAARRDHIERVIEPRLDGGAVVICDRYVDSTRAYQGAAGGANVELIDSLESHVVLQNVWPALTLILDLKPEKGLERAEARDLIQSRFEVRNISFHRQLRPAFLEIARNQPNRCVLIDADQAEDAVAEAIWSAVSPRLAV